MGTVAAAAVLGGTVHAADSPSPGSACRHIPETAGEAKDDSQDLALLALVEPINVGTKLGTSEVVEIHVDERKVGVVTLADESGRRWNAEICRRTSTDANVRPLALSRDYAIYLRNNGDGSVPTNEAIGRAALGIGRRLRENEVGLPTLALASRGEVWAASGYRPETANG